MRRLTALLAATLLLGLSAAPALADLDNDGVHEVDLKGNMSAGMRQAELEEFYEAVVEGKPLFHDGAWGLATLEAGLAVTDSGRERREIMMKHQVAVPADYDAEFPVPYLDGK